MRRSAILVALFAALLVTLLAVTRPGTLGPRYVATGADDGELYGSGASWPPSYTSGDTNGTQMVAGMYYQVGTYFLSEALLRFDTSAIPSSAVVTSASLSVNVNSVNGSVYLDGSYYASSNWPIVNSANYTTSGVGTTAFGPNIVGLANPYTFTLRNVSSIAKGTGAYTGFRLGPNFTSPPSGFNEAFIWTYEHSSTSSYLTVNYTVTQTSHRIFSLRCPQMHGTARPLATLFAGFPFAR